MARGTKLADLVYMLLAEIGDNSSPNELRKKELKTLLSNKQKWLASEYDWPFLQHQWDAPCPAMTQYITLPTLDVRGAAATINFERPVLHHVFWNDVYDEVDYGVGIPEYNYMNMALGQQSDPIQRIQLVSDDSELTNPSQFEVWPVPVTAQVIRFTGQRALEEIVADTDTADLDDMLLVYFVAAEILTRKKQVDAQLKVELAKQRLARLQRVYPAREQKVILGQKQQLSREERRILPIISIH